MVTSHGTKYLVEGYVSAQGGGETKPVMTVWVAEAQDPRPRLVTTYPRRGIRPTREPER
jgi:hypothetical protein